MFWVYTRPPLRATQLESLREDRRRPEEKALFPQKNVFHTWTHVMYQYPPGVYCVWGTGYFSPNSHLRVYVLRVRYAAISRRYNDGFARSGALSLCLMPCDHGLECLAAVAVSDRSDRSSSSPRSSPPYHKYLYGRTHSRAVPIWCNISVNCELPSCEQDQKSALRTFCG